MYPAAICKGTASFPQSTDCLIPISLQPDVTDLIYNYKFEYIKLSKFKISKVYMLQKYRDQKNWVCCKYLIPLTRVEIQYLEPV